MKIIYTSLLLFLLTYLTGWTQIPAFPGAEGFGAYTVGGRGGQIIKVTNVNDSGPGSLRAALQAEGPRTILFTTGGIIDLKTKLVIKNPFVTIAGQTAPGDGICIRGEGIRIYTHDVVIRYLRVRPGDIDFGPANSWGGLDAITIANDANSKQAPYNIIIDHCSLSWAVDEIVDMWNNTHDVTIQYCIISEALHESKHPIGPHSKGMLIGAWATNISIHHNLFSSNFKRNPLIVGESLVDFRNNVIYNYGQMASHLDRYSGIHVRLNYVNNYIKAGPSSRNKHALVVNERMDDRVKLYIVGNRSELVPEETDDNWVMISREDDKGKATFLDRGHQVSQEFPHPPTTTHTAAEAYQHVLNDVGANLPYSDPIDRKVISDVEQGLGSIVNSRTEVYNWPSYQNGTPLPDRDDDGLPDYWETLYGLNENDSADPLLDSDNNGYTNLEEYLNSTTQVVGFTNTMRISSTVASVEPPATLRLKQNYPNPFERSTNLSFTINSSAFVSLRLVNSQGGVVRQLINTFVYEGEYQVTVDGSILKPGIYCFMLTSPQGHKVVKAIKQ